MALKTKQDKIASWAGIGAALLVVIILSALVYGLIF